MNTRNGFVLKHTWTSQYLKKNGVDLSKSLFEALTFITEEDAKHWLYEGYWKPKYPSDFKIIEVEETKQEKEVSKDVGTTEAEPLPKN